MLPVRASTFLLSFLTDGTRERRELRKLRYVISSIDLSYFATMTVCS